MGGLFSAETKTIELSDGSTVYPVNVPHGCTAKLLRDAAVQQHPRLKGFNFTTPDVLNDEEVFLPDTISINPAGHVDTSGNDEIDLR